MPDETLDEDDSQTRFFPPVAREAAPAPARPRPPRGDGPVTLKVSAHSNPVSVAGSIAHEIRARGEATIRSIGAGALNQAVKAIAIARGYVAPQGLDIACVPGFSEVEIEGAKKTAITFTIFKR